MSKLETLQRIAAWTAATAGLAGFAAALGHRALPLLPPASAWAVHLLLAGAGLAAARFLRQRTAEIDRRRWQALEDPHLTSGEREWAHKEAERARHAATLCFLLAPLLVGYLFAHQFAEPVGRLARSVAGAPLVGFALGLVLGRSGRDR